MMLELRPNCECCNRDLRPDADAVVHNPKGCGAA